jgi:penicillin G amidase
VKLIKFIMFFLLLSAAAAAAAASPKEVIILPRLKAKVTVKVDVNGIPHIQAKSLSDLFFAQGYLQARDRLWQMDITRRQANGRMAALRGKDFVGQDYDTFRAGMPQVSERIWAEADKDERVVFQSYADGVNAYIKQLKELPEEYTEINATPELWLPQDSIAIGRGLSWVMSSSLGLEITLGVIAKTFGKNFILKFAPLEGLDPITITGGSAASSFPQERFDTRVAATLDSPLFTSGRNSFSPQVGSNNWVVSGKRTAGGFPLLSDDTHMGLSNPCVWYEVHLEAPGFNVVGMTVPGAPGVMIGHNEHVAWGVTTANYDVTDVYVEKPDPSRPKTHYMFKGKSLPFTEEKIDIKYRAPDGMRTETRVIQRTVHGPVVYESGVVGVLSFRWVGHEPSHEDRAFLGLMRARNIADVKKALNNFDVGALNFVAADDKGNIFYRGQGKVPIRAGTPFLPLDGESGKYEWTGYVPYNKLPSLENPPQGFIATANNRQAGKDYPYYLGVFYDKGYRASRITSLLAADPKIAFEKMQSIQADIYSLPAEHLLPLLYKAADAHPELLTDAAKSALEILKNWDRRETMDSTAPSIFYKWLKQCTLNIFKDDLPADVLGNIGRSEVVFHFLLKDPKLTIDFYDNKTTAGVREDKDTVLAKSLSDAVAELETQLGADPAQWQWAKLHHVTLGATLGGRFNIEPTPSDGGMDTVNVADFGLLGDNFDFGHGPSMRMTVELKPGAVSGQNVIAGGQSGDRASPHYNDQFPLWLNKKTHAMRFTPAEIAAAVERVIVMTPK